MSEDAHVQRLITLWERQLARLVAGRDKLTPEAQQRIDAMAALTRQRIAALKERLHQCRD